MTHARVVAEARVRRKSQVTLPESVVRAARVTEGDRFVVEVTPDDPDTIRLHRIRDSYAGTLADLFGDTDAYLQEQRATWER